MGRRVVGRPSVCTRRVDLKHLTHLIAADGTFPTLPTLWHLTHLPHLPHLTHRWHEGNSSNAIAQHPFPQRGTQAVCLAVVEGGRETCHPRKPFLVQGHSRSRIDIGTVFVKGGNMGWPTLYSCIHTLMECSHFTIHISQFTIHNSADRS